MQELFRFRLEAGVQAEKRATESETYWARVREVEEETGRPFGEVVHELRLRLKPAEIPARLGVSRHFLYEHFGWAMDKVAWVERTYGMPLGQVVDRRRDEGVTMGEISDDWGLAATTLYNALRRDRQPAKARVK